MIIYDIDKKEWDVFYIFFGVVGEKVLSILSI